jgi:hypothetical protein
MIARINAGVKAIRIVVQTRGSKRVMAAMLRMRKIDIEALKKAYEGRPG